MYSVLGTGGASVSASISASPGPRRRKPRFRRASKLLRVKRVARISTVGLGQSVPQTVRRFSLQCGMGESAVSCLGIQMVSESGFKTEKKKKSSSPRGRKDPKHHLAICSTSWGSQAPRDCQLSRSLRDIPEALGQPPPISERPTPSFPLVFCSI